MDGRIGDPAARRQAGRGAPEMIQGEMAQFVAERAVEAVRSGVAPERLAAVGVVDRRRRADVVRPAVLAVEQEPDGRFQALAGEEFPKLRALDAAVGRGPHLGNATLAPIKAVGHDAVAGGGRAGRHRRLDRAGDAGEARRQVGDLAAGHDRAEVAHRGDVPLAQAGNGEEHNRVTHRGGHASESGDRGSRTPPVPRRGRCGCGG